MVENIASGLYQLVKRYNDFNTWHNYQTQTIFGTSCTSTIKGGFYRWNWRWQARFWCSQLSSMEGYSNNWKSRNGAIEHAIEDYMQKGLRYGFLTQHQVRYPLASPVPTECPPISNTYTVSITSLSLNTESKEFQDGAERAKSYFYTCLNDPPVAKPTYASFMRITKEIYIDDQYTAEQIERCNNVPECVQGLRIKYNFVQQT